MFVVFQKLNSKNQLIVLNMDNQHDYFDDSDETDEESDVDEEYIEDLSERVRNLIKEIETENSEEYNLYSDLVLELFELSLKKGFKSLLDLEKLLLPSFIPEHMNEEISEKYRRMCLIAKIRLTQAKYYKRMRQSDGYSWLDIGYFLSRLIIKTSQSGFIIYMLQFSSCFIECDIPFEKGMDFFMFIFEQFKFCICTYVFDVFQILHATLLLFDVHLQKNKLRESKQFLAEVLKMIPDIGNDLYPQETMKIVSYISNMNTSKEELLKYKETLFKNIEKYGNKRFFQKLCKFIARSIENYSIHCKGDSPNFDLHSVYYEIFQKLTSFSLNLTPKCVGECECVLNRVHLIFCLPSATLRFFLSNLKMYDAPIELMKMLMNYIEDYVKFLIQKKKNYCEDWEDFWCEILILLQSILTIYFVKRKYEETLLIGHFIMKYRIIFGLRVLEEMDDTLLEDIEVITSSYFHQKRYSESLLWNTIAMIHSEKNSIIDLNSYQFGMIKNDAKHAESEIQELTTFSIVDKLPKEYEFFLYTFKKDKNLQIKLLINELNSYDKGNELAMMAAWRDLYYLQADTFILMKVFVNLFGKWNVLVHPKTVQILENIFDKYETKIERDFMVYVHFFRYKIELQKIIPNHLEEKEGIPNQNADPDILHQIKFSSYDGLSLNTEILEILKKCLKELEQIVPSGQDDLDFESLHSIAKQVTIEFNLHSDLRNFMKSSFVTLKIAKYLENDEYVRECTSYLIENTCPTNPTIDHSA